MKDFKSGGIIVNNLSVTEDLDSEEINRIEAQLKALGISIESETIAILKKIHPSLLNLITNFDESQKKLANLNKNLLISEEKHRKLMETSSELIFILEKDSYKIIDVNDTVERILGYSREEVIGTKSGSRVVHKQRGDYKKELDRLNKTGGYQGVFEVRKKNGGTVFFEVTGSSFGKYLYAIGRDVTERKMAEDFLRNSYEELEQKVKERTANLTRTNEELKVVIKKLEIARRAVEESREQFRILTEGSLVGVYIVQDNQFAYVNEALAETFGYSSDEIIGKLGPLDLTHPEDRDMVNEQINHRLSGEIESVKYSFQGVMKGGEPVYCNVLSRKHDYLGKTAFIGTLLDITEEKLAEEEMKRKLMKYKLNEGNIYLVEEPTPILSIEAFKDLLKVGYRGLVISRSPERELEILPVGDFSSLWLSYTDIKDSISPEFGVIESKMKQLPFRMGIVLEGLDFLIFKHDFSRTMTFVQKLREFAYLSHHIIIISIDPTVIDKRELALLKKETKEIETKHKEGLPEGLLGVLRLVYKKNSIGIKPSYTDIGKNLNISKPTVQKRIKLLVSAGNIIENRRGRQKIIEITDKGKNLVK
jgi:PAS domain S-box-containing protein